MVPGPVAQESPLGVGELAYRWSVAHWPRWAAMAGTTNRTALLPTAAAAFNDAAQAGRLIEDQRRAMGADGDVPAAREAEEIRLRAAVKGREAVAFSGG